jgi:hypothetical protein
MTNEPPELLQQSEPEPKKRDIVAEFIRASGFGTFIACRQLEKPSAENEPDIVDQYIKISGFGLPKRRN